MAQQVKKFVILLQGGQRVIIQGTGYTYPGDLQVLQEQEGKGPPVIVAQFSREFVLGIWDESAERTA